MIDLTEAQVQKFGEWFNLDQQNYITITQWGDTYNVARIVSYKMMPSNGNPTNPPYNPPTNPPTNPPYIPSTSGNTSTNYGTQGPDYEPEYTTQNTGTTTTGTVGTIGTTNFGSSDPINIGGQIGGWTFGVNNGQNQNQMLIIGGIGLVGLVLLMAEKKK
ncbi:MAG: hypothetical protein DI535_31065 [Citrobacter freundii]|nr:MAG: hypothetical protein DI535_31065 [Citrobacter freundii]